MLAVSVTAYGGDRGRATSENCQNVDCEIRNLGSLAAFSTSHIGVCYDSTPTLPPEFTSKWALETSRNAVNGPFSIGVIQDCSKSTIYQASFAIYYSHPMARAYCLHVCQVPSHFCCFGILFMETFISFSFESKAK